jgi:NAD(P)-dependent dehydrogenase (short-subunit alcohol dehydrogenase family)
MRKYGGGAIVNTSSGAGVKGFGGGVAYAAFKFGVVGLTKSAALDDAASDAASFVLGTPWFIDGGQTT